MPPPGKDGKAHLAHLGEVTDHPVEHEPGDPSALGDGADISSGECVVHVIRFDDDDRAGLRAMDGRVKHEVVPRRAPHGERRAGNARDRGPQRANADVHDLLASQDVGEGGR